MEPLVEVVRSFTRKINLGNYESADFFCSRKEQCRPADADAVSERLHKWCQEQVTADAHDFLEARRAKR